MESAKFSFLALGFTINHIVKIFFRTKDPEKHKRRFDVFQQVIEPFFYKKSRLRWRTKILLTTWKKSLKDRKSVV